MQCFFPPSPVFVRCCKHDLVKTHGEIAHVHSESVFRAHWIGELSIIAIVPAKCTQWQDVSA